MKLRLARKIFRAIDTPRESAYSRRQIDRAISRILRTKACRASNEFHDRLMSMRNRLLGVVFFGVDPCWLCDCGHYITDGMHCPLCRREPPWGCPGECCQGGGEDDWQDDYDIPFERENECIGSCDECGCDVYEDDAYEVGGDLLCDQCGWYVEQAGQG